jgi:hypothetical protein
MYILKGLFLLLLPHTCRQGFEWDSPNRKKKKDKEPIKREEGSQSKACKPWILRVFPRYSLKYTHVLVYYYCKRSKNPPDVRSQIRRMR